MVLWVATPRIDVIKFSEVNKRCVAADEKPAKPFNSLGGVEDVALTIESIEDCAMD